MFKGIADDEFSTSSILGGSQCTGFDFYKSFVMLIEAHVEAKADGGM